VISRGGRALLAAGIVVLALTAAASARQLARSRTVQLFGALVAEAPVRERVVALTIDDGPNDAMADTIVDVLRAHGARATFFVTGRELAASPAGGAKLVAAGHELANHSWSHRHLVLVGPARVRDELARTDSLIRRAGQRGPIRFRPPYGYKLVVLPWVLAREGRTTVMWSIEPDSYADVARSSRAIVRHVLDRVRPGSIVLLHAWYPSRRTSREAIGPLVDSLHARGYRVTTVGELLRTAAADSAGATTLTACRRVPCP
jgi:peptidoglycan/xylan/chitin deacetylase (PgdA/CDA1 family)